MQIISAYNRIRVCGQQKPAGIPRIDWSHSLTNRLVYYAWENNGNVINLVNPGYKYTLTNSASRLSPFGTGLYSTGTSGPEAAYVDNGGFMPGMYDVPFTIASGGYRRGTPSQYAGNMTQTANGGALPYNNATMLFNPSGSDGSQVSAAYPSSVPAQVIATTSSVTVSDESFFVIGMGPDTANSGVHVWVNGQDGSTTATPCSQFNLPGSISVHTMGSALFAGFTFFNARWSRVLSATEWRSLYRDPYQFLIPQESDFPALLLVAPAFKSAWARNRNTVIKGR